MKNHRAWSEVGYRFHGLGRTPKPKTFGGDPKAGGELFRVEPKAGEKRDCFLPPWLNPYMALRKESSGTGPTVDWMKAETN